MPATSQLIGKLSQHAKKLVDQLAQTKTRVVLAESCTAGLVSASLASCPGVSQWLCGSWVTYRNAAKIEWLGVSSETIDRMTETCHEVADQMAMGALQRTPEANLAAAVTGHLGPDAPETFDGIIFVSIAYRDRPKCSDRDSFKIELTRLERLDRQYEAALCVMEQMSKGLQILHPEIESHGDSKQS